LRFEKKVWVHQKRVSWELSIILEWKARARADLGPRTLEFFKSSKESRLGELHLVFTFWLRKCGLYEKLEWLLCILILDCFAFLEIFQKLLGEPLKPSGNSCWLNPISGFLPLTAWRCKTDAKWRTQVCNIFYALWFLGNFRDSWESL